MSGHQGIDTQAKLFTHEAPQTSGQVETLPNFAQAKTQAKHLT